MASLVLPSLAVQGFRGFQDLRIAKLGRVNLIVGKNNIGKSSLLEAIHVYATRGYSPQLWQILAAHDEDRRDGSSEAALSSLKYLFFGRKDITGPTDPIKIGPIDNPDQQLRISIDFYTLKYSRENELAWRIWPPKEYNIAEDPIPRFSIYLGENFATTTIATSRSQSPTRPLAIEFQDINVVSIDSNGLDKRTIAQLWDKIALTDHEQEALNALRIVAPGIEAISLISGPEQSQERIPIAKVRGMTEPLRIRSLGDGTQRMLGIALALVNAQNGILLIDEIENGLYYSIQADLWKLVFKIAHRLNIQVFATTHSADCIRAFQRAAQAEEDSKKSGISTTIFDESDLDTATQEGIEVR
jgi:ABC-type cobalamin/Fe3+-siderophores transport system ATPase subunit